MSEIRIVKIVKNYIYNNKKNDKEISIRDFFYFALWSDSFGSWNLKKKLINNFSYLYNFKNLIKYSFIYSKLELENFEVKNTNVFKNNKKNLIISYTNNLKIKKLYDNYFSCKITNSTKTHWFLINLDIYKNLNKLPKNLTIFSRKFNFFYFNIKFYFNLIYYFFFIIINKKKIFNKNFCNKVSYEVLKILKNSKITKIFIPYESQPHQHFLIKEIKKFNKDIKIIGYLHSSLTPLPVDFIKKNYEPDVLIVHGTIQKEILTKHLGWSKKEIVISNSFRYTKKAKKNFLNKIYLPISLVNKKKLKLNIKKFFQISKLDIKQFQIINHPIMVNSSNHLNFIKEIKKIKFNNKVFKKLSKNKVIVIGVSAVILEMLENNLEVIHICSQPIYEKHSSKIWHSLISRKLSEGVYSYKLKNRGTLIKFGKKNFFQKKYKIY